MSSSALSAGLLDKKVQFAEIEKIAYETEKKLLKEVALFDVYEGKNLEAGKKSYAVSFTLQDENATLNDKQIDFLDESGRAPTYTVMLNPEIIKKDGAYDTEEGCLSLLGGPRKCKRYKTIKVQYQTLEMQTRTKNFTGWTAQIIQHEVDHCNGILI